VAAHLEPEILIVDEVLAVGDMSFQKKCLGKMRDVAIQGRTVIFVSHNLSAVTGLCSRTVLLASGRVVRDGATVDVVATYIESETGLSGRVDYESQAESSTKERFKLGSVAVLDDNDSPTSVVSIEKPIKVRLKYYVGENGLSFRCALVFYTQGSCAFTTIERFETICERVGWYYSQVEIPGNLLAEGDYVVGVSVFSSRGTKFHYCKLDHAIAFQVYDPVVGNSSRGDYTERLAGVVRPLLLWHRKYLDDVPMSYHNNGM
jgi:lipopolysaccharide transport system ATP-binding protein